MWVATGQAISLEWGLQTSSTPWDFCAPAKMFQWQPSKTPPTDAPATAVPSPVDNRTLHRHLDALHSLRYAAVPVPDGFIPTALPLALLVLGLPKSESAIQYVTAE